MKHFCGITLLLLCSLSGVAQNILFAIQPISELQLGELCQARTTKKHK